MFVSEQKPSLQNETASGYVRRRWLLASVPALLVSAAGCSHKEQLGRNELLFVTNKQMASLADPVWQRALDSMRTNNDAAMVAPVERVAARILKASRNDPDEWEIAILQSDHAHIFALPNKKIGIYTGLLDRVKNDDELALLMAHALAHVNYNHYGERFSQSPLAKQGVSITAVMLGGVKFQEDVTALFGVATDMEELAPFSREHELAADKFSIRYLERAGFDPLVAPAFWRDLSSDGEGPQSMLVALHLIDGTRLAHLDQEIALLASVAKK